MAHQESWNCDASEGAGWQAPDGPPCTNNCGFLGCSATMNLCSKCYRELVLKQDLALASSRSSPPIQEQEKTAPIPANSRTASLSAESRSSTLLTSVSDLSRSSVIASSCLVMSPARISVQVNALSQNADLPMVPFEPGGQGPIHSNKKHTGNRCHTCQKRVGSLGFKCRCGDRFCATHRYSDKHPCSFDYKAAGREAIAKANPVIKSEKVVRL